MDIVFWILLVVVTCFSVVLIFGAPYLPTHKKQIELALELLKLQPGESLYELGCGDGRVLRAAARKGYRAVGYEMNPLLYIIAVISTWRYRKVTSIRFGNFWNADLSDADGVYVFLLDRFMSRLDEKLSKELKKGTRLTSYTFKIPGKKPVFARAGVFVYKY